MKLILILLGSYLAGSLPTAFLFLKYSHGIDIRVTGSGNVGAMNSYDITGSKKIGALIFYIDALKSMLPIVIIKLFFDNSFILCGFSLCASVFAHCFSPWIGFKGGRGLATAAGGALLIAPLILCGWLLIWNVFYLF